MMFFCFIGHCPGEETCFSKGGEYKMSYPELVVMLTYQDRTVDKAFQIFEECKNTKAKYWGFKEEPLPGGRGVYGGGMPGRSQEGCGMRC